MVSLDSFERVGKDRVERVKKRGGGEMYAGRRKREKEAFDSLSLDRLSVVVSLV